MNRGRSGGRNGGQGRNDNNNDRGITGGTETGLFTSSGRERFEGSSSGRNDFQRSSNNNNYNNDNNNGSGGGGGGGRSTRSSRNDLASRPHRSGLRGHTSLPPKPGTVSRDGDIQMGGDSERKKSYSPYQRPGRGRSQAGSSSNTPAQNIPGAPILVFVSGFKSTTGTQELIDFLSRKVSPTKFHATGVKLNSKGDIVTFGVGSSREAGALRTLSGIKLAGNKLIIKTSDATSGRNEDGSALPRTRLPTGSGTLAIIRQFIQSRHNNGFLNLENMSSDPLLKENRIQPPGSYAGKSDVGAVMMKLAKEMFPDIQTISFASNRLRTLIPISTVSQFFPNILNLSFQNNNIQSFSDIESLSGSKKLPHLRELILLDNPLRDNDIKAQGDDVGYRSEITRRFPSLQILDGVPVAPKISFGFGDLTKDEIKTSLPAPVRANFFDSDDTRGAVLAFLTRFYEVYDGNRAGLLDMYDPNATYSMCINTAVSPYMKENNQPGDSNWGQYTEASRNLQRHTSLTLRTDRLDVGASEIVKAISKLPKTKHEVSDPTKVCVDAFMTRDLLPAVCIFASVHGEFEEVDGRPKTRKSFDRSFILAPAPAGSRAAQAGLPCVIISDQLSLRSYNGHMAWQPAPPPGFDLAAISSLSSAAAAAAAGAAASATATGSGSQQAQTQVGPKRVGATSSTTLPTSTLPNAPAGSRPNPAQPPMPGISPPQHVLAQELQRITGLNYGYAVQCLSANAWEILPAMQLFEQNRAQIPPDAFVDTLF